MAKFQVHDISLFEFIIAITVVLVLILSVANMNLGQKNVIDDVSFEMNKQNFEQNISLIRAQWLLEGRPKTFVFNFYSDQNTVSGEKTFSLSAKGWPLIAKDGQQRCKNLWHDVNNLDEEDQVEKYVKIKNIEKKSDNSCQFCDAGHSDTCIIYSPRHGINIQINK